MAESRLDGPGGLRVSVDPGDLDVDVVHRWLSTDAYWALGRTREVVQRSAEGSVNLAAHLDEHFVGYARVVTDRTTFAWLCDVYVDPVARGRGVGDALVSRVVALGDTWGLRRTALATADAHALYARHGFTVAEPGRWMVRGAGA